MAKYPFRAIAGIEVNPSDCEISRRNLEALGVQNINVINIDAQEFNAYSKYNYFYFYNPFPSTVFSFVVSKIIANENRLRTDRTVVIYKNAHEAEVEILRSHGFRHIFSEPGIGRAYDAYERLPS